MLSKGSLPWDLMLCSRSPEIILSLYLCFVSEVLWDNGICTPGLEPQLVSGPASHYLLETGSQPTALPPPGAPGPTQQPHLCFWVTIHHWPRQGPGCRVGRAGMRKPECWPRPEAKVSAFSQDKPFRNSQSRYQAAPALRFKDPWGSPICQGLRQWGHGKRKCLAQCHQVPLQAEHRALVPCLVAEVIWQPVWAGAVLSCIQ